MEILKIYTGPDPVPEEPFIEPPKSDVQSDFETWSKEIVESEKAWEVHRSFGPLPK